MPLHKETKKELVKLFLIVCCFGALLVFLGWRGPFNFNMSCGQLVMGRSAPHPLTIPAKQLPETKGVANDLQESFASVASTIKPAVVNIATVHVESYQSAPYEFYFGDPFEEFFNIPQSKPARPRVYQHRFEGMGSGVVINPKGYILTNEHVVRGADEIKVTITDKNGDKTYVGRVAGTDARTDLAIVKIKSPHDLPYAALGNSDNIRVGDWAIAVGSPFGLEQTVTAGIISAVRQSLIIEGRTYKDLLQTDAAINRGNSGGPLVNLRGEVIGINTAIYAPTGVFAGIGFAIPVNRAKAIVGELIEKGKVVRGWMGVEIARVDEAVAKQFGLPDTTGALINGVMPGSPAERAGIRRGDVIKELNGTGVKSVEDLQESIANTLPNKKINMKIIRDGRQVTITMVTGEMPADTTGEIGQGEEKPKTQEKTEYFEWEGAKFAQLTPQIIEELGLTGKPEGVVTIEVQTGSTTEAIGLAPGDLVRGVNRKPITNLESASKAFKGVNLKEGIVLDIVRKGHPIYLSYRALE